MPIQSLAIQTSLIFHRFSGQVIEKSDYTVVRTPSRPDYFWGNFLIMHDLPGPGALAEWKARYASEFDIQKQGFITFAIDSPSGAEGEIAQFLDANFKAYRNKVLVATAVHKPPKENREIAVRPLVSEKDWQQVVEVHMSEDWYLDPASQRPFLTQQFEILRNMQEQKLGKRFGAFLGEKLVGDLGIYQDGKLGRFNNVATRPDHRRLGICGTLVHQAAQYALNEMGIETLVMEATEGEPAAAIYESVGFVSKQRFVGIEWRDREMHG